MRMTYTIHKMSRSRHDEKVTTAKNSGNSGCRRIIMLIKAAMGLARYNHDDVIIQNGRGCGILFKELK